MPSLLAELKRRNVFKVAFAYLILGWLVLQITDVVAPALRLPDWTISLVTFLGIIGFPFAMLFTWAFEMTPEGLKPTAAVDPSRSITSETGSQLNRLIIGMMAVAILLLLTERFFFSDREAATPEQPVATAQQEPGVATNTAPDKPHSIAVLPFVNMSNDPDQEYFSDGISEELLNGLAKIRDLRVAARTSSFAFKGQNQDITNIGEQLKVQTVLEGSVRKSGQRLRITAQLINVDDGYHLWSETYDRELTDIFAIQDEISAAIVDALKVHLTDAEGAGATRAVNLEAYNFYLLGRHSLRRRTETSLKQAITEYQKAIDIDPSYAEAWAGQATATALLSDTDYGDIPEAEANRRAQALVDMAFRLDPDLASAHAIQSLIHLDNGKPLESLASVDRAIALNPNEGILYSWRFNTLTVLGEYDQGMAAMEQAYRVDPLHPVVRRNLAVQYALRGDHARARELTAPDSALAWEIEATIANSQGRDYDQVRDLQNALERSEAGRNATLNDYLSLVYFFDLKEPELARGSVNRYLPLLYQSQLDPAAVLADPALREQAESTPMALWVYTQAAVLAGQCEPVLPLLALQDFAEGTLHGDISGGPGKVDLAIHYAWCLRQAGQDTEAAALARHVQEFIQFSVDNGSPPDYFVLLARTQVLLGDRDGAIGSLKLAWQHFRMSWVDVVSPFFAELRQDPEFQAIESALQSHMNGERAKLGLAPVTL